MSDEMEVANLVTKISIDDTGVERSMAELARQMKIVQTEFQAASAKLGEHANNLEGLRTKADGLNKQMEVQAQVVAKLKQKHQETATAKGTDARETQNLEIKLNKAVAQYNKLESQLRTTNEEIKKQQDALSSTKSTWDNISSSLDAAEKKMASFGQKMSAAGQSMSLMVTAPIAGVATAATKSSIDFESAFAGVKKNSRCNGGRV